MGNKSTHPSISRNVPPERFYKRAWGQWENHASTTRMTAPAQMPERRHTDPPWLWVASSLGAVVIHLLAFWILQLVMVRQQSVEISTEPIAIELIDIPEAQTAPEKAVITSTPKAQNQPESDSEKPGELEKEKIDQNSSPDAVTPSLGDRIPFLPRRQLASKPNPFKAVSPTTPADSTQTASSSPLSGSILPKPRVVPNDVRGTNAESLESSNPAHFPEPLPTTPTAQASLTAGSVSSTAAAVDNEATKDATASNSLPHTSPPSASNQAPPQPPQPPSQSETASAPQVSESQRGGGIVATLSNIRLVDETRDVPTQQAKPQLEEKQISSISYLPQLSKNLDGVLILQVTLLIDRTGTPEVLSTKVLQGSSSVNPEPLAKDIISDWKFEPAYMGGEPVDQEYFVSLKITPLLN
ncbi:MAG TPA: hypothetical protein V6D12_00440 [Candidatus Obscuribacterales bacterium]